MYWVDVQSEGNWPLNLEVLRKTAMATLAHQNAPDVEVAIVITDDESMQELNRRFRGVDAPTDVLAFPNEARGPFVSAPGFPRYLGDIAISYPRAEEQAAEAGHSTQAELQLLVVHGLLHLLGYDDQSEPERARMWAVQEAILRHLGVSVLLPE
ncbi:MAG: rRNA maturation RNase YbeY [Anaerolineae bacterium]|nr:rRNA maturation RNase YbeY [Anaerolineae bacterium]MDW8067800.1 rRNA maturation RNase YbeY [Anaerolineae bacterium]